MAEPEIVEDIEASYLSAMQHKLDTWGQLKKEVTIFHTPCHIRENNKDLFEPLVVSIGPFHRGNTRVRAMEEQKWQFLRQFLSRGKNISLDLCISEMKLLEMRTRRCYSKMVDLDSNGFVEMMLLDGCFLLEYFLTKKFQGSDYIVIEVGWNNNFIITDLLLLENQIPFFVVEKLYEIGVKQRDRINFVNDLIRCMSRGPTYHPLIPNPPAEINHLVHLYYQCSVPDPPVKLPIAIVRGIKEPIIVMRSALPIVWGSHSFHQIRMFCLRVQTIMFCLWKPTRMLSLRIKDLLIGTLLWVFTRRFPGSISQSSSLAFPNSPGNLSRMVMPCASELHDAGIKFRPKSNPQHMLDISFDHGVLEIPRQLISGYTKAPLANLVACEQSKYGKMGEHFSSFAVFLDSLVNTQKDAMILQQCGIVQNYLSGEEELTDFFNEVSKGVVLSSDNFLAELFVKVNKYCESNWNKQRAKLIRDYFGSPWAVISLVAAVVLLVLTFMQSFFAVYAYFVPPSS